MRSDLGAKRSASALEGKGEQTLLGGRVRLDPAVAQNVGDVIAALG